VGGKIEGWVGVRKKVSVHVGGWNEIWVGERSKLGWRKS
jgi:hypothetical protein